MTLKKKVIEGEEIIGELTHLEKILFTLFRLSVKAGRSLTEAHQHCENHGPDNPECQKLKELSEETQVLKNSFWFFVEKRLGTLSKDENLSIREGFQIVKLKEEDESEEGGFEHFVEALMGGGGMGVIGIGIGRR